MPFSKEIRQKVQLKDYNKIVSDLNDESKKEQVGRGNAKNAAKEK